MPNFRQGAPLKSTTSGRGRQIGCEQASRKMLDKLGELKQMRLTAQRLQQSWALPQWRELQTAKLKARIKEAHDQQNIKKQSSRITELEAA